MTKNRNYLNARLDSILAAIVQAELAGASAETLAGMRLQRDAVERMLSA